MGPAPDHVRREETGDGAVELPRGDSERSNPQTSWEARSALETWLSEAPWVSLLCGRPGPPPGTRVPGMGGEVPRKQRPASR